MSIFVLDTDHLSLYEKGHAHVLRNIALHANDPTTICVITIEEQLGGWQSALRKTKDDAKREEIYRRMALTVESLSGWPILPYSLSAMQHQKALLRMHRTVGINDLKIATIAMEHGATVVTRNIRDFARLPGLAFVDWSI